MLAEASARTQAENSAADRVVDRGQSHRRPARVAGELHRGRWPPARRRPRSRQPGGGPGDARRGRVGDRHRRRARGRRRPTAMLSRCRDRRCSRRARRDRIVSAATGGNHDRRTSGGRGVARRRVDRFPGTTRDRVRRSTADRGIRSTPSTHNIATAADPVGILLVRRRPHASRSAGSVDVADPGAHHRDTRRRRPTVVSLNSHQFAVASTSIGAGLTLAVATPFSGPPVGWQSILLLFAVILVAMLFIVVVVQIDLRRPLQRLDSAVAALGSGDFDRPVHRGLRGRGRQARAPASRRCASQVRSTMRITATPSHGRDGAQPRAAAGGSARQRLRRVARGRWTSTWR